jgi:hypothetical protein
MNFDHAHSILNRINRMFDDINESGGKASSLERDLLKEYVRRLYEALDNEVGDSAAAQSSSSSRQTEAPPRRVVEVRQPKLPSAHESAPAPAPPKPKVIEVPEEVEEDIRRTETMAGHKLQQVRADHTATVVQAPPIRTVEVEESPFVPAPQQLPEDIKAIFVSERSNDLSEKLAGSPIQDLTRAMAINERLLAQNELFGGNKAELDAALGHLNTLTQYEDAVAYLGGGAALKYKWAEEDRRPTARAFAKLVRRRYAN